LKLTDYIKDIGPTKFAEMIGVSTSQVWKYTTFQEVPRPAIARKIKTMTLGLVDYADIYDPHFDHHEVDPNQLSLDL
jgi:hypothetical protein